jgi:hypothetical protein
MKIKMFNAIKCVTCLVVVCFFALGLEGCGKTGTSAENIGTPKTDDRPELAAVLKEFQKEDVSMKSTVEELARMVRSGMIQDALAGLTKLSTNPKLKPEQKQALENLIASLKTK